MQGQGCKALISQLTESEPGKVTGNPELVGKRWDAHFTTQTRVSLEGTGRITEHPVLTVILKVLSDDTATELKKVLSIGLERTAIILLLSSWKEGVSNNNP